MMKVFAVYDAKAEQYGHPMFMTAQGLAIRGFVDACADPRSPIAQHPEDYFLHEIGTYDPVGGKLKGKSENVFVLSGHQAVAQNRKGIPAEEVVPSETEKQEEVKDVA